MKNQLRALAVATLTGLPFVVAMMVSREPAFAMTSEGSWLSFVQVLVVCQYFVPIALILLIANALRRPGNRMDLIQAGIGLVIAAVLGLLAGVYSVLGFDLSSGASEPAGPVGLTIVAATLAFFVWIEVRTAMGVASGPAVSMYWPLGLAVPVVTLTLMGSRGPTGPLELVLTLTFLAWFGMVPGFWISHLRRGRNLVAWFGLGASLVVMFGLLEFNPTIGYSVLLALLPLSLVGSKRGAATGPDAGAEDAPDEPSSWDADGPA